MVKGNSVCKVTGFAMASYVSEDYLMAAVKYKLRAPPADRIDGFILSDIINSQQKHNFGSLTSIRSALDQLSLEQGFRVMKKYQSARDARWLCTRSACEFFVRVNKKKDGSVMITDMNLMHNHPLFHDKSARHHPGVTHETVRDLSVLCYDICVYTICCVIDCVLPVLSVI